MKYKNIVVVDTETSIKNRGPEAIGTFKASPFHPDNKIVMLGQKALFWDGATVFDEPIVELVEDDHIFEEIEITDALLVGHNIGFDCLYLMKSDPKCRAFVEECGIWDTMIVEYLLSAQEQKFPSLDYCSEKYGGTLKPDTISKYWDDGIDTEDIPDGELREYLIGDVDNTSLVFAKQIQRAKDLGMLELIYTQMEARKATIEMEFNGLYFDKEAAERQMISLRKNRLLLAGSIAKDMSRVLTHPYIVPNPSSNEQVSVVLFGGSLPVETITECLDAEGNPIIFKSGKRKGEVKTKKVKDIVTFDGLIPTYAAEVSKSGAKYWSVDDSVLKNILDLPRTTVGPIMDAATIATKLIEFRTLEKDITTYYEGYGKLVWPTDSCIHPSYNHASTNTGRLSCSNPNLQNSTNEDE